MSMTRVFYRVRIRLTSPLSVGSGENEFTDSDILVGSDGKPFLPGTSIAGVLAHSCESDEIRQKLFGDDAVDTDGKMSPVIVYDAEVDGDSSVLKRDNVGLGERKETKTGAKFDYQVVDTGAYFNLLFEVNQAEKIGDEFERLINRMADNQIAFGHKTSRGFGRFKVIEVKKFEPKTFEELGTFEPLKNESWQNVPVYGGYRQEGDDPKGINITLHLKQRGGISIREYSGAMDDIDFVTLHSNGKAVIPGTSWAGAFRSDMIENLRDLSGLSYKQADTVVGRLFGTNETEEKGMVIRYLMTHSSLNHKQAAQVHNLYETDPSGAGSELKSLLGDDGYAVYSGMVQAAESKRGYRSSIVFEETALSNTHDVHVDRVKIDRFTGGAADKAKFDEKVAYCGNGDLKIHIASAEKASLAEDEYDALVGLVLLSVRDLSTGMLAVGGETGIGRGIFTVTNQDVTRDGEDVTDFSSYENALKKYVRSAGGSEHE